MTRPEVHLHDTVQIQSTVSHRRQKLLLKRNKRGDSPSFTNSKVVANTARWNPCSSGKMSITRFCWKHLFTVYGVRRPVQRFNTDGLYHYPRTGPLGSDQLESVPLVVLFSIKIDQLNFFTGAQQWRLFVTWIFLSFHTRRLIRRKTVNGYSITDWSENIVLNRTCFFEIFILALDFLDTQESWKKCKAIKPRWKSNKICINAWISNETAFVHFSRYCTLQSGIGPTRNF